MIGPHNALGAAFAAPDPPVSKDVTPPGSPDGLHERGPVDRLAMGCLSSVVLT
jgi:hypothetical protein